MKITNQEINKDVTKEAIKRLMEYQHKHLIDYVANENPEAVTFTGPSFDTAIVGYAMNDEGLPVFVYSYDKMVESLSEEMKEEAEPVSAAIEFIDYNTIRTLPYIPSRGRPIIMYGT